MSDKIRHKEKNMDMHDIQGGEKKVMTKFNKKMINVFATAALVAGVAAPVAAITAPTAIQAAGNGTISATNAPTVSSTAPENQDTVSRQFGSVVFTVPEGATLSEGNEVSISLPYEMTPVSAGESTYGYNGVLYNFGAFTGDNENMLILSKAAGFSTSDFRVELTSKKRIKLTYIGGTKEAVGDPLTFTLRLGDMLVEDGDNGAQEVELQAPSNSAFPVGKVVVANLNDSNDLNLSFSSLDTDNTLFTPKIVLSEPTAGALNSTTEVKIKLPSGYTWNSTPGNIDLIYGNIEKNKFDFSFNDGRRELVIKYSGAISSQASKVEIPFDFTVNDTAAVKAGDIIARVSGKTSTNVASAKIGTYGDYGTGVTATDAPTLTAGKDEQEVADFTLKETIGESLINNRTVELTLPEGVQWQSVYEEVYEAEAAGRSTSSIDYTAIEAPGGHDTIKDGDVTLKFAGYIGTDRRTAKYLVESKADADDAELEFEDIEVALASDFSGDLKVTFGGTSGVKGEALLAKVVSPVSATAATKPNVKIGATNQAAAEFTVTEGQAGALTDDGRVVIDLPYGVYFNVYFNGTPTVEVTSGDIVLTNVRVSGDRNQLWFTVDADSDTASTIKVSGVNLELDRTVPEGDIKVEVRGSAVSETEKYSKWANNTAAAIVAIANTATPAPTDQSAVETVFTLGSTSYSVNGESRTADVAPYSENGRTYLPVRYVADALGVTPQNILFDKATSTVTLLKGDRVVQIKLNTNQLIVNGSVIAMDVKAVTKDNRTVLPIRWVGQALGADVSYDETAKTITVK